MAENYNEPEFSRTEFSPEERRRMRRMLWYYDRSDFVWTTIRRWATIWGIVAVSVVFLKDGIKWVLKAIMGQT